MSFVSSGLDSDIEAHTPCGVRRASDTKNLIDATTQLCITSNSPLNPVTMVHVVDIPVLLPSSEGAALGSECVEVTFQAVDAGATWTSDEEPENNVCFALCVYDGIKQFRGSFAKAQALARDMRHEDGLERNAMMSPLLESDICRMVANPALQRFADLVNVEIRVYTLYPIPGLPHTKRLKRALVVKPDRGSALVLHIALDAVRQHYVRLLHDPLTGAQLALAQAAKARQVELDAAYARALQAEEMRLAADDCPTSSASSASAPSATYASVAAARTPRAPCLAAAH